MTFAQFQTLIEDIYGAKDHARPVGVNLAWLVEEVGELSRALRHGDREAMAEEFADVAAWLTTIASQCGVRMEDAIRKYAHGCPKCASIPCQCADPSRAC